MKIAYIDSQNIKMWIKELGREIDWEKFYHYLKTRYKINKVKFFVWYLSTHHETYKELKEIGYHVLFKNTHEHDGKVKWNVDTLIMRVWIEDYYQWELSQAYLLSGDWDFDVLINFWKQHHCFTKIFIPNHKKLPSIINDCTTVSEKVFFYTLENLIKVKPVKT
jgi:uncharacterized LabA/DUF88 family protein